MTTRIPTPHRTLARALAALGAVTLLPAAPQALRAQDIEKVPEPVPEVGQAPGDTRTPRGARVGRFLVGDEAPDIDLKDSGGRRFRLSSERKERPWLVFFARRPEDAAAAERSRASIAPLGLGMVVVAPFARSRVYDWFPEPRVRFLQDGPSRTARIFGLYDAVTTNPRPGVFLVGRDQRILLMVSGGIPSGEELARLAREAMELAREPMPEPAGPAG